jgi:two-component system, OmpR family, response regulator ResD
MLVESICTPKPIFSPEVSVTMNKTILIADDNKSITDILAAYMKKAGYETVIALDGEEAMIKFKDSAPALVLLDVMMPKMDGFTVCKEIRRDSDTPIIMVTARSDDFDKIMGLEIGADDYIVKPFNPAEVVARIKAVLRRVDTGDEGSGKILRIQGLKIDIDGNEVELNAKKISLTKKEIDILWLLASNPNKVFSRDNLLSSIWGYEYLGDSRTVDTHITRLRAKLDDGITRNWDVKTIWGIGYKFEVENG